MCWLGETNLINVLYKVKKKNTGLCSARKATTESDSENNEQTAILNISQKNPSQFRMILLSTNLSEFPAAIVYYTAPQTTKHFTRGCTVGEK